jgi:hypothetical protein
VTCPYQQLPERSVPQSQLWRVRIISYPKDQYRSNTVTCYHHELPEGSVPQSHCDVILSSGTRSISTAVTQCRVPVISYPKDQYSSHTVTCPYQTLPEGSVPQSHCDMSLSSVTRTISNAVTHWRVPIISYPKDQYRSHTVMCHHHELPEGSVPQSHCDVNLSSVTRSISTAVTLCRVPVISYPKDQYCSHTVTCPIKSYPKEHYRSHTVTCPYHQLPEG